MSYASALALVSLSAVFLLAGILAQSTPAFILAIVASMVAVALLARRVRRRRHKTFVNSPPPRVDPTWTLKTKDVDDSQLPVELEVDHIIDDYRSLVAAEVLPSLETLSADELRKVINIERNGRNRQAIIRRAEMLLELTEKSISVSDVVLDPDAPVGRRTVSATKTHEREGRQSLRKSGPSLGL
jgi:CHASE2 domain-containing sensor protein